MKTMKASSKIVNFQRESGKGGAARWGDKIMYNFDDVYQYRAY